MEFEQYLLYVDILLLYIISDKLLYILYITFNYICNTYFLYKYFSYLYYTILYSIYKDFSNQRYNTPYLHNMISIHTSRCKQQYQIDLGLPKFAYYTVFIALLSYMQYKQ